MSCVRSCYGTEKIQPIWWLHIFTYWRFRGIILIVSGNWIIIILIYLNHDYFKHTYVFVKNLMWPHRIHFWSFLLICIHFIVKWKQQQNWIAKIIDLRVRTIISKFMNIWFLQCDLVMQYYLRVHSIFTIQQFLMHNFDFLAKRVI